MKNVISFSLWGNNPRYITHAVTNAKVAPNVYPNWVCRFYVDSSVPQNVIDELKHYNSEIFLCEHSQGTSGSFWRFLVNDDPDVNYYVVRDADSIINYREYAAVQDWLNSNKNFHIMRDHPNGHRYPISAGMFGGKANVFQIKPLIKTFFERKGTTFTNYIDDQYFLANYVYPIIKDDSLQHDDYFNSVFGNSTPFPKHKPCTYGCYVGQRVPFIEEKYLPYFNKIVTLQKQNNYRYKKILNIEKTNEDCSFFNKMFWEPLKDNLVDDLLKVEQTTTPIVALNNEDTILFSFTYTNIIDTI